MEPLNLVCCLEVFPGEFGLLFQFEVGRTGKVGAAWRRPCGELGVARQQLGLGVVSSQPVCLIARCAWLLAAVVGTVDIYWTCKSFTWVQIYWPIFMSDLCSSSRPRCQRGPRGRGRGCGHDISGFILTAVHLYLLLDLILTVYLNTCDGLNMSAAVRSRCCVWVDYLCW